MARVLIVDWSHWHPITDARALKANGIGGGIGKVTEGPGHMDSTWLTGRNALRSVGLPVGGYHFYRFANSPAQNAEGFLAAYGDPGLCAIPPALDAEDDQATGDKVGQAAALLEWCRIVEAATGRVPMNYSNRYWWQAHVEDHGQFARYPLWSSGYPRNDGTDPAHLTPMAPFGHWPKWTIWQFTSAWSVPGISGRCDCSVADAADFAALLARTPHPAPPEPLPAFTRTITGAAAGSLTSSERVLVSRLQDLLQWNAARHREPAQNPGPSDGRYGPHTIAAWKAFKTMVNGICALTGKPAFFVPVDDTFGPKGLDMCAWWAGQP